MKPVREKALAGALLAVFFALAFTSAARESATIDEFAHLPAGLYAWKTRDFSLYAKTPPLSRMILTLPALLFRPAIAADLSRFPRTSWQPWNYAADFLAKNQADYGRLLLAARLAVIVAGMLLCFLVWRESRKRYGPWGGLVSLAAAAFSPTLIAHSHLVTTDVMAALLSMLFILAWLAYLRAPSLGRSALMALALGLGVLAKFTGLFFLPFMLAAPPVAYFLARRKEGHGLEFKKMIAHLALGLVLAWLTLAAGYFGKGLTDHGDLRIASQSLTPLAPLLRASPLPRDFISGLDQQMADAESGEWGQGNYLFGEWYGGHKPYYYLAAVLIKEPLPQLALFLLAVILIFRERPRPREELFMLFVIATYFTAASLVGSLQIGVRYLLPIYPLAFLLVGRTGEVIAKSFDVNRRGAIHRAQDAEEGAINCAPTDEKQIAIPRWHRTAKLILIMFAAWTLIDQVMIWPHYLAYFNALAGGPSNGSKCLLDSNLDWGQDLPGLADWMKTNQVARIDLAYFGHDDPARFGIAYDLPGRGNNNRYLAVSANLLMGKRYPMTFAKENVTKDDPLWDEIKIFRDQKPVTMIGYSIFIFDRPSRASGSDDGSEKP